MDAPNEAWCRAVATLVTALAGNISDNVMMVTLSPAGSGWHVLFVVAERDADTLDAIADIADTLEAVTGDARRYLIDVKVKDSQRIVVPSWPEGLVYLKRGVME